MLRNPLSTNFNYRSSDIVLQVIDWKSYDIYKKNENEESEEEQSQDSDEEIKPKKMSKHLIIRGYGVTEDGIQFVFI